MFKKWNINLKDLYDKICNSHDITLKWMNCWIILPFLWSKISLVFFFSFFYGNNIFGPYKNHKVGL